jgi:hypothetical protein
MSNHQKVVAAHDWSSYQKLSLKFFTLFFGLLTIPLDYKFYAYLFSGDWLDFNITDLVKIVSYLPGFFNEVDDENYLGFNGFYSWGLALFLAVIGIFVWNNLEKKGYRSISGYDHIYYWLRVILRYKLAFILIAYGAIKAFPLQFPFPSLSNLHTNYGDFLPWKIWNHTIGITPNYAAFLGGVEILSGILLLSRPTVTFGAGLILGVLINVVFSSFAYELGNQVLATYVLVVALFLFAHDIPRLYSLLYKEQFTIAESFVPSLSERARLVAKALSVVFGLVIFLSALFNYKDDPYLIPKQEGLKNAYGFYNVKDFIINKDTIPYSRTDTNRWQNVVFEKWATISIKTAKSIKVDPTLYLTKELTDIDRVYESAGVGDRRYFRYTIDSVSNQLYLKNKNANHASESFRLTISRPDDKTIILKGINENKDSIKTVLERVDRKYMLIEGRRHPIQL